MFKTIARGFLLIELFRPQYPLEWQLSVSFRSVFFILSSTLKYLVCVCLLRSESTFASFLLAKVLAVYIYL